VTYSAAMEATFRQLHQTASPEHLRTPKAAKAPEIHQLKLYCRTIRPMREDKKMFVLPTTGARL